VKCSILYKGDGLVLTVYACYLWEVALNGNLITAFNNVQDWKGIWEKAGKVIERKLMRLQLNSQRVLH
jgi:hypothetical protein